MSKVKNIIIDQINTEQEAAGLTRLYNALQKMERRQLKNKLKKIESMPQLKILKRHASKGVIYNTSDIDEATPSNLMPSHTDWLCNSEHSAGMPDLVFLRQYFPADHPIFHYYGESYYYVVA